MIKKTQLLFLLLILAATINSAKAQTSVGVNAGVNFSKILATDRSGEKINSEYIPSLRIGLTVDIPIFGNFSVQPAVLYSQKGFKQATEGFYRTAKNFEVKAEYVEFPVNIFYKPKLAGGRLLIAAGPYLNVGTGGSWKSDNHIIIGDIQIDNKGDVIFRNDGSDGGSMESFTYGRPIDYGANFLLGYEFFSKLSIQLNAQMGIANLTPRFGDFQPEDKLRNSAFGISLGYKF